MITGYRRRRCLRFPEARLRVEYLAGSNTQDKRVVFPKAAVREYCLDRLLDAHAESIRYQPTSVCLLSLSICAICARGGGAARIGEFAHFSVNLRLFL
eukprot:3045631-Pyramimonas_sp.AAC.1